VEQSSSLLHREPITEAHPEAPHAFHAADPRPFCQLGTEEPSIGGFIGDAPNGGESQIDRGRGVVPLFEVDAVPEDNGAVEGEARLPAVPRDELCDRVIVRALTTGGGQAVQDGGFGLFEIGERQHALGRLLPTGLRLGLRHRRRPPGPSPGSFNIDSPCGVTEDLQLGHLARPHVRHGVVGRHSVACGKSRQPLSGVNASSGLA